MAVKKKVKKKARKKKVVPEVDLAEIIECLKQDKPDKAFVRLLPSMDHEFMVRYLFQYLCASKFSTYRKSIQTFGLTINDYLATKNKSKVEAFQSKLMKMATVETHYRTLHDIQASILTYVLTSKPKSANDALSNIVITEIGLNLQENMEEVRKKYNNRLIGIVADLAAAKWENGKTLKVLYGQ